MHNARLVIGDCAAPYRRFLDFYAMVGNTLLVIEVDEHQHKAYDSEDEELRIHEIHNNIGIEKHMVFIRFNPSGYKTAAGKRAQMPLERRLATLKETITDVLTTPEHKDYEDMCTEIKLFYDAC